MLHQRLLDPGLAASETAFLQRFVPAFNELCSSEGEEELYVEGTARLFPPGQIHDTAEVNELISMLERRVVLLRVLREALAEPGVYVRIGQENEIPAMRSLAVVATGYGMAGRKLGTVSVIGPVRMDYGCAIATVRDAASELSRFVEDTYAEN
jgi:heat-inducible transcriptional repressor